MNWGGVHSQYSIEMSPRVDESRIPDDWFPWCYWHWVLTDSGQESSLGCKQKTKENVTLNICKMCRLQEMYKICWHVRSIVQHIKHWLENTIDLLIVCPGTNGRIEWLSELNILLFHFIQTSLFVLYRKYEWFERKNPWNSYDYEQMWHILYCVWSISEMLFTSRILTLSSE